MGNSVAEMLFGTASQKVSKSIFAVPIVESLIPKTIRREWDSEFAARIQKTLPRAGPILQYMARNSLLVACARFRGETEMLPLGLRICFFPTIFMSSTTDNKPNFSCTNRPSHGKISHLKKHLFRMFVPRTTGSSIVSKARLCRGILIHISGLVTESLNQFDGVNRHSTTRLTRNGRNPAACAEAPLLCEHGSVPFIFDRVPHHSHLVFYRSVLQVPLSSDDSTQCSRSALFSFLLGPLDCGLGCNFLFIPCR